MPGDPYPKVYLYRRIVQAKLFIDCHYADKIDLRHSSGEASFSKFHFIRLFKKIYGKSPHQYLTFVRIQKAKELLMEGVPVSETCFLVGFDSLGSFTPLFKRHVGLSPSLFMEKQLQAKRQLRAQPLGFVPGCFSRAGAR